MTGSDSYKTAQEVADKVGFTKDTIYAWAQDGKIPIAFRASGRLRFDLDAVITALAEETRDA